VVIANPPYNAWQLDENDNNKNRKYPEIDKKIRLTYSDDSTATLKNSLSDPYIKAIKWASDRIGESGIVCFVTNSGFVDGLACDGMRKHLAKDFDLIYILDLGGNVRKNPKLSGTTHNVFGIQLGVSINVFIRLPRSKDAVRKAKILYYAVTVDWRKEQKYQFLETKGSIAAVKWKRLTPDKKNNWLTSGNEEEFSSFPIIGEKHAGTEPVSLFNLFCRGTCTNNDPYVYDFRKEVLESRVRKMVESYSVELARWQKHGRGKNVEDVIHVDPLVLKWIRRTKRELERETEAEFDSALIRTAQYRPFCKQAFYFERLFNEDLYRLPTFFPTINSEKENRAIVLTDSGSEKPFMALMCRHIPDMHIVGGGASAQVFPFYSYSEDGKHKQDNITPKARTLFQIFYADDGITAADIFHYVYAVLHHPAYRTRFAENLKRDLPRIPFIGVAVGEKNASFYPLAAVETMQGDNKPGHNPKASAKLFHTFADAGKKLADLHVNYESAKEFPLKRQENKEAKLDWRVEAMKLSKDKASLFYNDFLTLTGIPPEVFGYKLGNRSALEWVIDQYRVTKDDQGNIVSDPNRMDDEQYIVRLIGQVITVSLETIKIVGGLPELKFGGG